MPGAAAEAGVDLVAVVVVVERLHLRPALSNSLALLEQLPQEAAVVAAPRA
jgi:hypothetical protein